MMMKKCNSPPTPFFISPSLPSGFVCSSIALLPSCLPLFLSFFLYLSPSFLSSLTHNFLPFSNYLFLLFSNSISLFLPISFFPSHSFLRNVFYLMRILHKLHKKEEIISFVRNERRVDEEVSILLNFYKMQNRRDPNNYCI